MGKTPLRQAREREGLTRMDLARIAGLAEKTLQRAEAGEEVSVVTQNRIINALNRRTERLRDYDVADLFASDRVGHDLA